MPLQTGGIAVAQACTVTHISPGIPWQPGKMMENVEPQI